MIDYADKTVLITGGASGIGKALAEAFAARGAEVIIADRQAEAAEAVAASLNGFAISCDLSDPAAPAALIDRAFGWRGRLDLVCANAGYGRNKRIIKDPFDEAAMSMFAVNLFAPFRLAQAYAAALTAAGQRGRLMITGSENSLSLPGGVYTRLIAKHIPDPKDLPPEMHIIMPERCAEIALKGLDLGLFYIPTHAHIADDMRPRTDCVIYALKALGLVP